MISVDLEDRVERNYIVNTEVNRNEPTDKTGLLFIALVISSIISITVLGMYCKVCLEVILCLTLMAAICLVIFLIAKYFYVYCNRQN